MWIRLPNSNKLFRKYLKPWYLKGERPNMVRPDFYVISAFKNEYLKIDEIQYLPDEVMSEVKKSFEIMRDAYSQDFQSFHQFDIINLNVIDAFDEFYNRKNVIKLIKNSDPKDFSNDYLVTVCELGLALGDLFVQTGKFEWLYSYPYFHSIVVNPESGIGITVFDWAVKKLSSYGLDDGISEKFQKALEIVDEEIEKINSGA